MEICLVCQKELTDKSINKANGVAVDAQGRSYHLNPCWYEKKRKVEK